jgi:THO complex subunit 2
MYENYIALLKHYKPDEDTICQIVGFKFQSLSAQRATEHLTHNSNNSLYKITAYLLKHQLIDLDALLAHISPTDVQIAQTCKEELEAAKQYATKLSSIQLSTAGDSSSSTTASSSSNGDVNTNQAEPCQLILQYQQMQAHKPIENQRVNLVTSLVEIEDYATAIKLIEKMPNWYLATNCDVTIAICRALDRNFIDSMYKRYKMLTTY